MEVHRNNIDPEDKDVIEKVIEKLEIWFGKPKIENGSDHWRILRDIKRGETESMHDFVIQYETAESNVKAFEREISNEILAIKLLDSIYVNEMERQNIVSHVKFEDNPNFYEDMKKSAKLLKGSLVEGKKKDSEESYFSSVSSDKAENDVLYSKNKAKNFYESRGGI